MTPLTFTVGRSVGVGGYVRSWLYHGDLLAKTKHAGHGL